MARRATDHATAANELPTGLLRSASTATVIGGFASLVLIPLGLGAIEARNTIGEIGVGTNRSPVMKWPGIATNVPSLMC
jgi:hypothetical protein